MKKTLIIIFSVLGAILLLGGAYGVYNYLQVSTLESIEVKDNMKNDDKMILVINLDKPKFVINQETYCAVSSSESKKSWIKAKNNKCELEVEDATYTIFLKNKYGYTTEIKNKEVELNKIKNLAFNKEHFYLAVGGSEEFKLNFEKYGLVNEKVNYKIDNEELVKIEDNKFVGLKAGDAKVTATVGNKSVETIVHVMSSIVVANVDTNSKKEYVPCLPYNEEEAAMLDAALKDRIDTAGYQTRAGVVAAAYFLGLEFEYRVPYFFESGRLVNHSGIKHIDAEGRYYHKGLYLTESKFADLEPGAKYIGPKTWGCKMKNGTSKYGYVAGRMYPNGLDCSGFISWVLLNGGFDVGDVGAGDNTYRDDDLYDLGEKRSISIDLIKSGEVKPGDLIAYWGHMAMVMGIDDNYIYVAESLPMTKGAIVKKYTHKKAVSIFVNIMLMDDVYKEDGNLIDHWAK